MFLQHRIMDIRATQNKHGIYFDWAILIMKWKLYTPIVTMHEMKRRTNKREKTKTKKKKLWELATDEGKETRRKYRESEFAVDAVNFIDKLWSLSMHLQLHTYESGLSSYGRWRQCFFLFVFWFSFGVAVFSRPILHVARSTAYSVFITLIIVSTNIVYYDCYCCVHGHIYSIVFELWGCDAVCIQ